MEDQVTPRDRTVKESEGASALDGDADMLQRLLASLTINALRAMPTGGRLTKTARASNGAVELGVRYRAWHQGRLRHDLRAFPHHEGARGRVGLDRCSESQRHMVDASTWSAPPAVALGLPCGCR